MLSTRIVHVFAAHARAKPLIRTNLWPESRPRLRIALESLRLDAWLFSGRKSPGVDEKAKLGLDLLGCGRSDSQ